MIKTENRFQDKYTIISFIISIIFLIPILYYPISCDLSIYISEGKLIADGGKIYSDLIDIKPPMFYYFYSLIYNLTGLNEFNIRIFDFIWQFFTLFALYFYVLKVFKDKFSAQILLPIYSILYVSVGYIASMHTESFITLFLIRILLLENKEDRRILDLTLEALILGLITSMKFTFGIIYIAVIINDLLLLNDNFKSFAKKHFTIISISGIVIALSFLPLLDKEIFSGFKNGTQYLSFYSALPHLSLSTLKMSLKTISIFFGDNFSLFYTFSLVVGLYSLVKNSSIEIDRKKSLIFISFLMLFFSVLIERKLAVMHFVRIFGISSIIITFGIKYIFESGIFKNSNRRLKPFIAIIILGTLLFSPIPRALNLFQPVYYFYKSNEKFNQFYSDNLNIHLRTNFIQIAEFINSKTTSKDSVIVISTGGNVINYFLKDCRKSAFTQSCFYLSEVNIQDWSKKIELEMQSAKYLIIQDNDIHPMLTGNDFSSLENIKSKPNLNYILQNRFTLDTLMKPFHIYRCIIK
jgi:hypothetical protein